MKARRVFGLCLGMILMHLTGAFFSVQPAPSPFVRILLPAAVVHPPFGKDADGDGASECFTLHDGAVEILKISNPQNCSAPDGAPALWRSPQTWEVVQAAWTDIDHDTAPELAMLVWRPYRAWYVERYMLHTGRTAGFHDSQGRSCHLIFIGWKENGFREVWAGSALSQPVAAFAAFDVYGNRKEELVTMDAHYSERKHGAVHSMGIWEWNGFGFTLLERLSRTSGTFWITN